VYSDVTGNIVIMSFLIRCCVFGRYVVARKWVDSTLFRRMCLGTYCMTKALGIDFSLASD
jgi:hypothetical protein